MTRAFVLLLLLCALPSAHAASPKLNAALVKAIDYGNSAQIRKLIAQGANVNARNDIGQTMLEQAAQYEAYDSVKLLLDMGANVNSTSRYGGPLIMAVRNVFDQRPVAVCRLLLDRGADPKGSNRDNTPLISALNGLASYLNIAPVFFPYESAEAKRDRLKNRMDSTLAILQALLQKGANINAQASNGETPLFLVTLKPDAPVVKFLLAHGADLTFADKHGKTPLYWAKEMKNEELITLLLAAGAKK